MRPMMALSLCTRFLISLGSLLSLSATALAAATLTVTNTNDNLAGSLRQAIQDANAGDRIVFQIPTTDAGYNSTARIFTIGLTSANLVIAKDLTIDSAGQKITVLRNTSTQFRIFYVTAGTVTISGLTITNGKAGTDGDGGGGFLNNGNLTLVNCIFIGNDGPTYGGGIFNYGTLVVTNCTFYGNTAGFGAGILNEAALAIAGSTFYLNAASGSGGAINHAGSSLSVTNSTITKNTSGAAGGGIAGGATHVRNTVVADNTASQSSADVFGDFVSDGYNFIGVFNNQATGFGNSGSHDQIGTNASPANPNLGPLQDNGGPTLTCRPMPGSPLIDQGSSGGATTDQRGSPRVVDQPAIPNAGGGDGCDIGAIEDGLNQSGPSFVVTNNDIHDDGQCTADDCTLAEALNASNANSDANTITFAPDVVGQILTYGMLITNPVSIIGPGARNLSISGWATGVRLFFVSAQNVLISGLTLSKGSAHGDGGAIINTGSLTVTDCALYSNLAFGGTSNGGAINNVSGAFLTLIRCTFDSNNADQFGGALFNEGTFSATNCTFVFNGATRGGAIISRYNNGNSSATLRNCAIAGNTATSTSGGIADGGGGYYAEGGAQQHHVANTIIALNNNGSVNPDVRGSLTSDGHNFIGKSGTSSAGFTNGVNGDQVGTNASGLNPQFGVYGYNGGQTQTLTLLSISTAINAGNDALAPITDQRTFSRAGVSDIGAFEFGGTPPPIHLGSAVSRKTHGSAGTFDVNLPASGTPGIEDRSGSASNAYQIAAQFSNAVTFTTASVTAGNGHVDSTAGSGTSQLTLNLSGVTNAQTIQVKIAGLNDGTAAGDIVIPMSILIGDTTGNGTVNASDVSQTKIQSGQPVTAANCREDVTANGTINASDVSSVKAQSGTSLP